MADQFFENEILEKDPKSLFSFISLFNVFFQGGGSLLYLTPQMANMGPPPGKILMKSSTPFFGKFL